MNTKPIEITAEERGLLLRTLEWAMKQQDDLPFNSRPSDYWACNKLRQKLSDMTPNYVVREQPITD
jgi:hypothetical protein